MRRAPRFLPLWIFSKSTLTDDSRNFRNSWKSGEQLISVSECLHWKIHLCKTIQDHPVQPDFSRIWQDEDEAFLLAHTCRITCWKTYRSKGCPRCMCDANWTGKHYSLYKLTSPSSTLKSFINSRAFIDKILLQHMLTVHTRSHNVFTVRWRCD